jgi:fermentation-respiration switch protein FrsA (DUF1100 family)
MSVGKWIISAVIALGIALIILRLWSRKVEKGLVFFPERDIYVTPENYGLPYEDVYFTTGDGIRLNGWYVSGPSDKVILWFHGNAGNIADRAENLALLVKLVGASVFIFDYREYGRSEGEISKAGTFIDADAAYDNLLKERKIAEEKIVLFGRSLGSALAVYLSSKFRPGYLIIESAFTSSDDVADLYYPFMKHLLKTSANYETSGLIGEIEVPKLIIHGERDEIIPLWMGRKLYDLATGQKEMYIIPGAAHNDTYIVGGEEYFRKIKKFISG